MKIDPNALKSVKQAQDHKNVSREMARIDAYAAKVQGLDGTSRDKLEAPEDVFVSGLTYRGCDGLTALVQNGQFRGQATHWRTSFVDRQNQPHFESYKEEVGRQEDDRTVHYLSETPSYRTEILVDKATGSYEVTQKRKFWGLL